MGLASGLLAAVKGYAPPTALNAPQQTPFFFCSCLQLCAMLQQTPFFLRVPPVLCHAATADSPPLQCMCPSPSRAPPTHTQTFPRQQRFPMPGAAGRGLLGQACGGCARFSAVMPSAPSCGVLQCNGGGPHLNMPPLLSALPQGPMGLQRPNPPLPPLCVWPSSARLCPPRCAPALLAAPAAACPAGRPCLHACTSQHSAFGAGWCPMKALCWLPLVLRDGSRLHSCTCQSEGAERSADRLRTPAVHPRLVPCAMHEASPNRARFAQP